VVPNLHPNPPAAGIPQPEPTIAELALQLKLMQASLHNADGEIAIARAEAKAARKSVETVSLQNQIHIAEVEAESAAAKRQVTSLQTQLDAIDVYKRAAPSFANRGNEIQFNHNTNVVNDLTRALTALELGSVDDVDKYIRRSIFTLKKRNKCIRIAEDSPFGWATVDEYLKSELASDDEDDRKLKRAETSAEAKIKRNFGKSKGKGSTPQKGKASTSIQYKHADTCNCDGCQEAESAAPSTAAVSPPQKKTSYTKPPMSCYYCQGPHMRVHCTKLAEDTAAAQAKIEADYAAQQQYALQNAPQNAPQHAPQQYQTQQQYPAPAQYPGQQQ
jgi:hypothetical protein